MRSATPWFSPSHAIKCELAGEVLRSSGWLRLQVTGWSMLPSIWPGDVLLIKRAERRDISEGDIILYSRDRRLVVHRVVGRQIGTNADAPSAGATQTRGDAMPTTDPLVADADLLGKVSLIQRNGRRIEPRKSLRISERAVALFARRSEFAARVIVRVHGFRQRSSNQNPQDQLSQFQISNNQAVLCQP
jgi:signal peptidase I